jgi:hypothetical protein
MSIYAPDKEVIEQVEAIAEEATDHMRDLGIRIASVSVNEVASVNGTRFYHATIAFTLGGDDE